MRIKELEETVEEEREARLRVSCLLSTAENETLSIQVPVPWAGYFQCWNINIIFSSKTHGSNFIRQHSETVMVWNLQTADCCLKINLLCHLLSFSAHFRSLLTVSHLLISGESRDGPGQGRSRWPWPGVNSSDWNSIPHLREDQFGKGDRQGYGRWVRGQNQVLDKSPRSWCCCSVL